MVTKKPHLFDEAFLWMRCGAIIFFKTHSYIGLRTDIIEISIRPWL